MEGYYVERLASDIHDELYTRALVLKDGKKTIAIVTVDLVDVAQDAFDEARRRIESELGIPAKNVVITASHTHTGPLFNPAYNRILTTKLFDAVKIANQNQEQVTISSGTGMEKSVSFHRRFMMKDGTVKFNPGVLNPDIVRPMGPIDPEVGILKVTKANGETLAILVNFAIHLDTVGGTEISADFPAFISEVLKRVVGDDAMIMFGLGTCGNLNHFNVKSPETSKRFWSCRANRICTCSQRDSRIASA